MKTVHLLGEIAQWEPWPKFFMENGHHPFSYWFWKINKWNIPKRNLIGRLWLRFWWYLAWKGKN